MSPGNQPPGFGRGGDGSDPVDRGQQDQGVRPANQARHAHGGHSHGSHGFHAHGGHSPPGHGQEGSGEHAASPLLPHAALSYRFRETSSPLPRVPLELQAGRGRVLFLDCGSGIAGDMTMAALFDLGVPTEVVTNELAKLELEVRVAVKSGLVGVLGATQVDVVYRDATHHRRYGEIRDLLLDGRLDPGVAQMAAAVFARLARAEAEVHRIAPEDVEFHEVGSLDAIADVVGVSALVVYLGASVVSSPLPLSRGWVEAAHGALPLPAPATLLCLEGAPTYPAGLSGEWVTPTGAALVTTIASSFDEWPRMRPLRVGVGAGHRVVEGRPNILRAVLGEPVEPLEVARELFLLEANLDDSTPEVLGYVQGALLGLGARDVWLTPVVMKKSRPGVVLSVLVDSARGDEFTSWMLRETTTLGVRKSRVSRVELPRRVEVLATRFGSIRYKLSGDPPFKFKVEADDAIRAAEQFHEPLVEVLSELERLGRSHFLDRS